MAIPVPNHPARGLHGGEVVAAEALHGRDLQRRGGPHGRRGFLRPFARHRARGENQAPALGHGGPGAIQVGYQHLSFPAEGEVT